MNVGNWLEKSEGLLKNKSLSTARLDCLVLLEDETGKDRAWLLAHPDLALTHEQINNLDGLIARRAKHEPLAYIRGKTEFYGRDFKVNKHTLEPRPETEAIIDAVKSIVKSRENITIADIGTGSGCIAISVKLEIPNSTVFGTDIDVKCLEIARENSEKLNAKVSFFEGSLLEPIKKPVDILLCNLPYVPTHYQLNEAATFEPKHAIFGGEDGLNLYRQLFSQTSRAEYVLTESLPFQHCELTLIAKTAGYELTDTDDFIQVFKFVGQPLA